MSNIFLEGTSVTEFLVKIENSVKQATSELQLEVEELRKQIRDGSRVTVSHRAATAYFDGAISPDRILDYIHGRRLPEGAPGPLRAHKTGQHWFIKVSDLQRWQLGLPPED